MFTTTVVYQFLKGWVWASEFEFHFFRSRLTLIVCNKHTCHLVGWFVLACIALFLQILNRICWYSFPISDIQSENRCIEQNLNLFDTLAKKRPPSLLWFELKSVRNQTTKSVLCYSDRAPSTGIKWMNARAFRNFELYITCL